MRRQVVIMISIALISFLAGTLFSFNYVAIGGKPNPLDKVWEAIYGLQSRVDSLNGTVIEQQAKLSELQTEVNTIENKINQVKTIRFFDPAEHMSTGSWNTLKSFTWTPHNTTDNAILSVTCFFEYNLTWGLGGSPSFSCRININDWTLEWLDPAISYWDFDYRFSHWDPHDYIWSPTLTAPLHYRTNSWTEGFHPIRPSYNLQFQMTVGAVTTVWVKNINIIITVIDGLSASG